LYVSGSQAARVAWTASAWVGVIKSRRCFVHRFFCVYENTILLMYALLWSTLIDLQMNCREFDEQIADDEEDITAFAPHLHLMPQRGSAASAGQVV
jgi:hypothetical protein